MGVCRGGLGNWEPLIRLKLGVKKGFREAGNGQRLLDKEGTVPRLTLQTLKGASVPEALTPKRGVHFWEVADQPVLSAFWFLGRSWPGGPVTWSPMLLGSVTCIETLQNIVSIVSVQLGPEGRKDNGNKEGLLARDQLQNSVNQTTAS